MSVNLSDGRKNIQYFDLSVGPIDQSTSEQKNSSQRLSWASKTESLLSYAGYAMGISSVLRFPYLCYRNGGGAFLVPYTLMIVFCGIPLFFMETSMGQFGASSCILVFRMCPLFKGAGIAMVIVNLMITVFYNVVISYPLLFMSMSFKNKLPWEKCDNSWNSDRCLELVNIKMQRFNTSDQSFSVENRPLTPADEFFHNQVLQISKGIDDLGGIVWPLFFGNLISWIIVFLCISKGVKSVGKVVYFTATFPFLILLVLFVRGVTLPGAIDGVLFYITPQWDQLLNLRVWADAANQVFFTLGPGWGGIVNMASFNPFRNNSRTDSIIVPILYGGMSIFAGFVVFSVLGFMAHQTGLPVSTVAIGGPGLAFITYPEAIAMLPLSQLWSLLFFFMLYLLGLDTLFVLMDAAVTSVVDVSPFLTKHKSLVLLVFALVLFLSSLIFVTNGGMYLIQLFDWYAASITVILICFVEVLIIGWTYGCKNFVRDIEFMIGEKMHWWWPLCWKYITPIILLFVFSTTIIFNTRVTYNGVEYPDWAIQLGWGSCLFSSLCIPAYAISYVFLQKGSVMENLRKGLSPTQDWGPLKMKDRVAWENLKQDR